MISNERRSRFLVFLLIAIFLAPDEAWSFSKGELKRYLTDFGANPAKVMDQPLMRRDSKGRPVKKSESLFSEQDISSRKFVEFKAKKRGEFCRVEADGKRFCLKSHGALSQIQGNDRPEYLLELSYIENNIANMESRNLREASVPQTPWSDSYWPFFRGELGVRYADPNFPWSNDWLTNYNYVWSSDAWSVFSSGSPTRINRLSPAEKYDLAMGDGNLTLTKYDWGTGQGYYNSYGYVPSWMGICEGWSAAAIFMPEPTHGISVTAPNGQNIWFYPSDIRALASLLWARGAPSNMHFIGGRCNVSNPAKDANGRIIDQSCFDTNPGTWHISVVNEIGVAGKSFIMDAQFDYEVWNQPVVSYSYSYFNPQTRNVTNDLSRAEIPVSLFTNDKFRAYRSPYARYVVGVAMDVTYVVELGSTTEEGSRSDTRTVTYVYDLELDGSGRIIGGEWYSNMHPDFLWNPYSGSRAVSVADGYLSPSQWSGHGALPAAWQNGARSASPYGQPLAAFVEKAIQLSR